MKVVIFLRTYRSIAKSAKEEMVPSHIGGSEPFLRSLDSLEVPILKIHNPISQLCTKQKLQNSGVLPYFSSMPFR